MTASTSRAPIRLATWASAPVVPTFVTRDPDGRFVIRIEPPVALDEEDEEGSLERLNARIGDRIRERPELWFWVHNRWRVPRRFAGGDEGPAPRILVRSVNWLGDAVMTLPAVQRLREGCPRASITLMGPPGLASLWQADPRVDAYIPTPDGGPWRAAAAIRAADFDVALVFPSSFRAGSECLLGDVPRRIGYAGHGRGWMLSEVVPRTPVEGKRHQAHDYLDLVAAVGGNPELCAPHVFVSAEDRAFAAEAAGLRGCGVIGIHAGARYGPAKRWPSDRFAEVAKAFADRGCRILLFGGQDERGLVASIAERAGGKGIADLAGRTTLGQLAATLQCCDVVVSNDTGPMHLAAAVGTPVVAVFGSTDPDRTAPLGNVRIVRTPVPCSPCFRRTCPIDFPCMMRISTEMVVWEVDRMLSAKETAAGAEDGG